MKLYITPIWLFLILMMTTLSSAAEILLIVGDASFTVELEDTPAAHELLSRLPLALHMADLNANEKYADIPKALPMKSEAVGSIHTGDLMLFGSTCMVLFYKDFRTPYRYTRLGRVKEAASLPSVLGRGSVDIRLQTP